MMLTCNFFSNKMTLDLWSRTYVCNYFFSNRRAQCLLVISIHGLDNFMFILQISCLLGNSCMESIVSIQDIPEW